MIPILGAGAAVKFLAFFPNAKARASLERAMLLGKHPSLVPIPSSGVNFGGYQTRDHGTRTTAPGQQCPGRWMYTAARRTPRLMGRRLIVPGRRAVKSRKSEVQSREG